MTTGHSAGDNAALGQGCPKGLELSREDSALYCILLPSNAKHGAVKPEVSNGPQEEGREAEAAQCHGALSCGRQERLRPNARQAAAALTAEGKGVSGGWAVASSTSSPLGRRHGVSLHRESR